jgi:hypothetical protein
MYEDTYLGTICVPGPLKAGPRFLWTINRVGPLPERTWCH